MKKLALTLGMLIMAAVTVWFLNYSEQDNGPKGPKSDYDSNPYTEDIISQLDSLESNQWNKGQNEINAGKSSANEEEIKKVSTPLNKESKIQKKTEDKVNSEKPKDTAAKESEGNTKGEKELRLEIQKALDDYKKDKDYDEKTYGYYFKRFEGLKLMAKPIRTKELKKIMDELRAEGIMK